MRDTPRTRLAYKLLARRGGATNVFRVVALVLALGWGRKLPSHAVAASSQPGLTRAAAVPRAAARAPAGGARSLWSDPRAPLDAQLAPFTFVTLPDTQYYAARHPEILRAQTRWIVEERVPGNIALVLHEGDIVDHDDAQQWTRASESLHLLDGVVPYVLSPGNHDYRRSGDFVTRGSLIDAYFPVSTFASTPWFKGTFQPRHIANSFQIIDAPGGAWLIISLEFGARDAVLRWADRIAKRYASLPAVVVTHAYLSSDDTRYDHLTRPDQRWNPHRYLSDAVAGDVNDGEEIWRKLIRKNDNILFVLCGHDLGDGIGRLTSLRPDGSKVHQLLANFQMDALGGGGYLRVMRFFPAERRVEVRTYSPYLDRFKTDPDNQFALDY